MMMMMMMMMRRGWGKKGLMRDDNNKQDKRLVEGRVETLADDLGAALGAADLEDDIRVREAVVVLWQQVPGTHDRDKKVYADAHRDNALHSSSTRPCIRSVTLVVVVVAVFCGVVDN